MVVERAKQHSTFLRKNQSIFTPKIGGGAHRLRPKKSMVGTYQVECTDGTQVALIHPVTRVFKVSGVVSVPAFIR